MWRPDPLVMPLTGETPEQRLANSLQLTGTPGQQYVEKRGITVSVADQAGVRFDPYWNGRAAVIVPMLDNNGKLCSVHGRYLLQSGSQNKMFTIGPGGGILSVGKGLHNDPVIIVEGLFDALSLALHGYSSLATVGRIAPWLPEACAQKSVILAFDGNKPGEATAVFYKQYLSSSKTYRLMPPGHSKDWNTAVLKNTPGHVKQWLQRNLPRFL